MIKMKNSRALVQLDENLSNCSVAAKVNKKPVSNL